MSERNGGNNPNKKAESEITLYSFCLKERLKVGGEALNAYYSREGVLRINCPNCPAYADFKPKDGGVKMRKPRKLQDAVYPKYDAVVEGGIVFYDDGGCTQCSTKN